MRSFAQMMRILTQTRERLFGLDIPEIARQVIDSHATEILIPIYLRKDRPPNGHGPGPMAAQHRCFTGNDAIHLRQRKLPTVAGSNSGQVGRRDFEPDCHRAMALRIFTMAGSAINFIEFGSLHGDDQWLFVRRPRPCSLSVLRIRRNTSQQSAANHQTADQTAYRSCGHNTQYYCK